MFPPATPSRPRLRLAPAIAVLFFWLALGAATSAQNPELTGTWMLDVEASDERRNGEPLVERELTVALVGDDVRITRQFGAGPGPGRVHEATYVTDGKTHEVPGLLTPTQKVRARWRKDKLQISYTVDRGGFGLDVTEVWELAKNGDLEIVYSTRVQDRNLIRKEIYHRQ